MVNSWGDDEFTSRGQLGEIDRIAADPDYIALGTGHPQGGNALSRDPKRGVVGPGLQGPRLRRPVRLRRERVPHQPDREPAAHGHGARPLRRPADRGRRVYDVTVPRGPGGPRVLRGAADGDPGGQAADRAVRAPHLRGHRPRLGGAGVRRQLPALPGRPHELPAVGRRTSCTRSCGSGSASPGCISASARTSRWPCRSCSSRRSASSSSTPSSSRSGRGTWTTSSHVFEGNFAYVLGWSLADGTYPVITLFALRLAATRIPRLAVT